MPIAAVQRVAKGSAGAAANVSIGSADGWATPTTGNLLVFSANSDALVTLSGAGTVSSGPSIIDGNGTYTWYKIATGAETTITGTPSVTDDIVITACEYSGVSAFDVANSATIAGSNGSVTTAATVTTTAAADLVVGFALLHNTTQTNHGTGPAWSNGFVNVLTANTGVVSTNAVRCNTFVGELLTAGAAGSYSTVCSWTNDYANRQHIVLAFKASAGGTVGAISGSAVATPSAAGSLTLRAALAGTAVASPAATGALTVKGALAGSAATTPVATGALVIASALPVSGSAIATPVASGSLTARLSVAGTAATAPVATGSLTPVSPIAGSAATTPVAAGALTAISGAQVLPISGTAVATPAASGALTLRAAVAGAATATPAAAGSLVLRAVLSGTAQATPLAAGVLTLVGPAGAITLRPFIGTTARPGTGRTARPFVGVTTRP